MAKILLGSSERHRLATSDYLASLLEGTTEINRVGKGLLPDDMTEIAAYVSAHPKVERLFLSGNNLGLAGARLLSALLPARLPTAPHAAAHVTAHAAATRSEAPPSRPAAAPLRAACSFGRHRVRA